MNTPLDNILNVRLFATFFRQFHVKFLKRAFYFRSLVTNIKSFLLVCKSKRNIYLVPSRYARKLLHEAVSVILFPNFMECNFIGKTSCFTWWQPFFKRRKKSVCCSKGLLFFESICFEFRRMKASQGTKARFAYFLGPTWPVNNALQWCRELNQNHRNTILVLLVNFKNNEVERDRAYEKNWPGTTDLDGNTITTSSSQILHLHVNC